ncbi:MAG: M23 family metallopeptidase [Paracoccus sp. (in: a-proteobacteria)]|nr:M23 family metallopeptidase [Paracoccus sp. (in: a-proteobacteria)]
MQVDPRFREMGQTARQRRRKTAALRGGVISAVVLLAGGLAGWRYAPEIGARWTRLTDTTRMTQVEAEFDIAPVTHGAGFTDIPGDPMFIPRSRRDAGSGARTLPAPEALIRAGYGGGASQVAVLQTDLRTPDRQLVAALPSTREELAMFQAERSRARAVQPAPDSAGATTAPRPGDPDAPVVSGTVWLREAARRTPLWTDTIVETVTPRPLAGLLADNGVPPAEAERAAARFHEAFDAGDELAPGTVLALRYRGDEAARQIIQLALYDRSSGYLGSMAMAGSGQLVAAVDAFTEQALLPGADEDGADGFQPQRLLDMIYSAALRSDLTPDEAGTALAMMAKIHDLDGFADAADRLTIIRAQAAPDRPGPLLFIGVNGPSGDKPCYIVADDGSSEPGCFQRRKASVAGGLALTPPVAGVMAQRFVPMGEGGDGDTPGGGDLLRGHVVWSAPQGSPVHAAAAGTVTAFGPQAPWGLSVEITHEGGAITRYRGLGEIAPDLAEGGRIAAGAPLGSVGKPPGYDQPGLIFQLIEAGQPVDPARQIGGTVEVAGSNAVEALIGQIIRVESGGNARARNPLSTASGLGQFIESTWLRMMRSYRPDLVASMSRAELLELRFDPALSREMVRRLAQENEAYLRARGHDISPGRLYLAHFLGPAGADQALRADPSAPVLAVMGNAVVSANPFLRGYTIADLRNWADRKMGGMRGDSGLPAMVELPIPPQVQAAITALDQIRNAL